MNSKSLRRLAGDHGSLHTLGLPPNYLFPTASGSSHSCCDDLSSLDVLLAGPEGTPFEDSIFILHLTIPKEYPNAPPTATFKTKIWHPNVDEQGAVCVDTLKSGWDKNLGLRDVLITISCLLIQPNPASALNAEAGALIQDGEWKAFERRARIMSSIHAPIPPHLKEAVREARRRGEDAIDDVEQKKIGRKAKVEKSKDKGKVKVTIEEINNEEEENMGVSKVTAPRRSEGNPDGTMRPAPKALGLGTDNIFGISTGEVPSRDDAMDIDSSVGTIIHNADVSVTDFAQAETPARRSSKSQNLQRHVSFGHGVADMHLVSPVRPTNEIQSKEDELDTSSVSLPPLNFSWMNTPQRARIHGKVVQRTAESLRREKQELKKMKAAGFSIEKYNRGQFGPRKGLMRL